MHALVSLFLDAHSYGFTIGIAFLVPHVFILGYLIIKSGYFPKVLGYLFIAAGIGYLVDTIGLLLVPGYTTTPGLIAMVIAVAELAFPIWLLVKGVNMDRMAKENVGSCFSTAAATRLETSVTECRLQKSGVLLVTHRNTSILLKSFS